MLFFHHNMHFKDEVRSKSRSRLVRAITISSNNTTSSVAVILPTAQYFMYLINSDWSFGCLGEHLIKLGTTGEWKLLPAVFASVESAENIPHWNNNYA